MVLFSPDFKYKVDPFNLSNIDNYVNGNWLKKLSSNERARKMQKDEPSPTSMRQMVLKIFHFKVRNLGKMDIAIL